MIAAFSAIVANAVNLTEEEAPTCGCPEMPACPMPPMPEDEACCAKTRNHYHYHYQCECPSEPVETTLNPVCDPESIIYNESDVACVCDPNSALYDETDLRCQLPFVCYDDLAMYLMYEGVTPLEDYLGGEWAFDTVCANAICVSTSELIPEFEEITSGADSCANFTGADD